MRQDSSSQLAPITIADSYEAYGCKVNAIGVDELFRRYEQAGFLYPAKMQRLAPFMPLVRENWQRALAGNESILTIISSDQSNNAREAWASVASWRSTHSGWNPQHVVCYGKPSASRAVMLATQVAHIRNQFGVSQSGQNWFQRSNGFANKVFGSITNTLGASVGWVGDYSYFALPLNGISTAYSGIHVQTHEAGDRPLIYALAARTYSPVYAVAEGLDDEDLGLESVDDLYRKAGLRRYRRVLVARISGMENLAGFALAYRGPLGLNFSFLENRCALVLDPTLATEQRTAVIRALLAAAAEHYADFPPKMIPVIVDKAYAPDLIALKAEYVRDYAQSIWLRDGYELWYRHVERIYERAIQAEQRRLTRHGQL